MEARIKEWAKELGFDDCRIAVARRASHADGFSDWIAQGKHGAMGWMERNPERRSDPREVLEDCRAIICLAMNYYPGDSPGGREADHPPKANYRIARYAWNDDYHDLIEDRLKEFRQRLESLGGTHKAYVDTGPVLERDFASDAGLGWNGKSTMQIHRRLGTWFFLAEILTTLPLQADPAFGDHCGKCTACISACPTAAITAPRQLDARRCISYLTIEHKGPIPEEFRAAMGDRIYGCDDCLDACPWNRFAEVSREAAFHAREAVFQLRLRDFLTLDDEAFRKLFARSPIKRIKRARFLRNVCIALGNSGGPDDLPMLENAAADPDDLISEHARWAIQRLRLRHPGHQDSLPQDPCRD